MSGESVMVVTPWFDEKRLNRFLNAWDVSVRDRRLVLQHDEHREGSGATKNKGVEVAVSRGADVVVILDDDCYPCTETPTLDALIHQHRDVLNQQAEVQMFEVVTEPPSRGTPYGSLGMHMPVAASMGFWREIGDYCAVRQLAYGVDHPMEPVVDAVFGRYFPLCGMNLAFRPKKWDPWCRFIEVSRFDDIWMGWLWQREAYRRGYCFSLAGPKVTHVRKSDVWASLKDEARYLGESEDLWRKIATSEQWSYEALKLLLPILDE